MTSPESLAQRLEDIASKAALACTVASAPDELTEQAKVGFFLILCDMREELHKISEEFRKGEAHR